MIICYPLDLYLIMRKDCSSLLKLPFLCLLTSLLLVPASAQVSFAVSNISASPNTAGSTNAVYTIELTAISTFTANYDLTVNFPSGFSLSSVTSCALSINAASVSGAVCALTSASVITFSSFTSSATVANMTLVFTSDAAQYAGSFTISLVYYEPGNDANRFGSNSALITFVVNSMTCGLTSSSDKVGEAATYSLSYSPSVTISSGSIVQVVLPAWSSYTLTNFPSATATTVCAGQCTIRTPNAATSTLTQILTYSALYSSGSSNSNNTLLLQQARNPSSTQTISYSVNVLTSASNTYMSCTGTFAVTQAGTLSSVTFTPTDLSVSGSSSISILVSLTNPISSSSYLRITYPTDMSLGYTYATSNQATTQRIETSSAGLLLLTDLTNSTSSFTTLFMATFTFNNPPYADHPLSVTFATQNQDGGTFYLIDTLSKDYTFTTNALTSPTVTASNYSINAITTYTLGFTIANQLIANSLIIVTIPSEITTSASTTCLLSVGSTCSRLSSTLQATLTTGPVTAGTSLTMTINSIQNPSTTTASSTFGITTYYYNTSTPVNTLTSSLTLTATATSLQSATVNPTSLTVAATTTYTITLQNQHLLPSGAYITIVFPSASFPASSSTMLTSFTANSNPVAGCTLTQPTSLTFNLTNCITTDLAASSTISLTLGNINNPLSTAPTQSLSISTYFNNELMQSMPSGLTVTMTTPTTIPFAGVAATNTQVNQQTTYEFTATFGQTYNTGSKIIVTFPDTITLNTGFVCSSTSGISVTCSQSGSDLTITMTGTIPITVVVAVTKVVNNWYSSTPSFTLTTATSDSTLYYVQRGTGSLSLTPASLTTLYTSSNLLVLLSQSTVNIRITPPFTATAPNPSLLTLTVILPNQLTLINTACSVTVTATCRYVSSSSLTVTNFASFPSTLNLTFTANATHFTNSSTFTIALDYNSSAIANDNTLIVSAYCESPCMACTTTNTECTSCLPLPYTTQNYLYQANNSCLNACPSTFYIPSDGTTTCLSCNSSACLDCVTTANTCTSCSDPLFLFGNQCLQVCPDTYYGTNNLCTVCVNQCHNCTSATYCLSCDSGYSLNPDNTCQLTCPLAYTSISSVCQACTGSCVTCSGAVDFCASCNSSLILYNGTCINQCPVGFYVDGNNRCQVCISPCSFCSAALTCTTCVSGFYIFNTTQCLSACPAGYFLPSGLTSCSSCDSTCQTCSAVATNCTSCTSPRNIYLNTCYETCPDPTFPHNGTCTTCVEPCATCGNGAFICSSCITSYFLLNTSCVTSCPSTGYLQTGTSCVACPSNCLQCSSSINCTTCEANFFSYQGNCLTSCPANSPIIVSQTCSSCDVQCATCQNSPDACLVCTLGYFRHSYTCVDSCPVGHFSNSVDMTCENGLTSKINFFPVLIAFGVAIIATIIIKCCAQSTSVLTVLTALSGWFQLILWIYLLTLLFDDILEPDINYAFPRAVNILAIILIGALNIVHFKLALPPIEEDEYSKKWQDINVNHTYFLIVRWVALFSHCKFFRLIYSKFLNSMHFSLVAKRPSALFRMSTVVTLVTLVVAQAPVVGGCFYLAYNKLYKDQLFYTSVEVVVVCILTVLISLLDIYKSTDYFDDTEFIETMKYLEKVNNQSLNRVEDEYRKHEEGSVDGQKFVSTSGGKFIFSKQDPHSMGELLFEDASAATDAGKRKEFNSDNSSVEPNSPRSTNRFSRSKSLRKSEMDRGVINIFEPIQEEQAEYYEVLKYDEEDFKTAAKIEDEKIEGNESEEEGEMELMRKEEYGTDGNEDDNRSLLEYRERREQWNNIIRHRQKLASHIFNTIDSKELEIIEEPEEEDKQPVPIPNKRQRKLKKSNAKQPFDVRFTREDQAQRETRLKEEGRRMEETRRQRKQRKRARQEQRMMMQEQLMSIEQQQQPHPPPIPIPRQQASSSFATYPQPPPIRRPPPVHFPEQKIEHVLIEDDEDFSPPYQQQGPPLPPQRKTEYGRMGQHLRVEYNPMFGDEVRGIRERMGQAPQRNDDIRVEMPDDEDYMRVRRRRKGRSRRGKNELQQIYLQRLADRKKMGNTSMGFNYEF